jgi:phosphatidylglycerophosphatase C
LHIKNKKKLAIFDFCETLVNFQTADEYILYVARKEKINVKKKEIIRRMLQRLRLLSGKRNKEFILEYIKNVDFDKLQRYSKNYTDEYIRTNENIEVVEKLLWHKAKGHITIIVSGGYKNYIDMYAEIYGVDYVIATEMEIDNNKITGKIVGLDCMGKNKLVKINNNLNLENFDLDNSYVYSDHESDMPIFSLVGNPFAVSSETTPPLWAVKNNISQLKICEHETV